MSGICGYEMCDRNASCKGLCGTHYAQARAGKELTPIRTYVRSEHDENGRVCTECFVKKPQSEFYRENGTKCKECFIKKYTGGKD